MKRNNTKFIIFVFCFILLELTACTSNPKAIEGKYIDIYDETHYVSFDKDGTFIDNFLTTTSKGNTSISDCYVYQIDGNNFISIINTEEYEWQDELDKYDFGWLYDDKIGKWLNGELPTNDIETTISCLLNGYEFKFHFKEDKTYEYTVTSNNEIVHTENGTYEINGNEVVCTSKEGVATTFIGAEDKVFCIEYVKE